MKNTWQYKTIRISFDTLDNTSSNSLNDNESFDIGHSICIHKTKGESTLSTVKNIDELSQIIFLKDSIDKVISLDYKSKSQLNDEISSENYLRRSYIYNCKLEDEYIGTHGINIERVDIEYKNETDLQINLETYFNLTITFYDEDEPHIGTSTTIRHIHKDDLIRFSNTVSSFIDMCN